MQRLPKLLLMIGLAGIVTFGSFLAGMVYYANFLAAPQLAAAPAFETGILLSQRPEPNTAGVPDEFNTFWEAWSFLDDQFYGEVPSDSERVYGAIRGMVNAFDDQHTAFIDPARAAVMSENIRGSFEGIGATIRLNEIDQLVVVEALPDRPAFKAGLHPGDVILKIDDGSVKGLSLYEAVSLIRGPAGSSVVLTIEREAEPEVFQVEVVRAKIEIQIVEAQLLPDAPEIGYVKLAQFSNGAARKVARAIKTLRDQGATAIIFDLRSNPGGLLSEAVEVSSLFVAEGTVVIEKLKDGQQKKFEAGNHPHVATDVPLVVLVNGGSASASEIVAGAMQDLQRAALIGEQTFGKGTVQLPHDLSDGSELRVTIAEWLTPASRQIHGQGITPDVIVEMTATDTEQELDPQLDAAVEYLQQSSPMSLNESTQ
ncbi:MAG: S41 family peptidase [Anaerolineales bacterium]|nr:S41 family peptidase [Anaerolineales bacterium]